MDVALVRSGAPAGLPAPQRQTVGEAKRAARTARPPRGALRATPPRRRRRDWSTASASRLPRRGARAARGPGRRRARSAASAARAARRRRARSTLDAQSRELVPKRDASPVDARACPTAGTRRAGGRAAGERLEEPQLRHAMERRRPPRAASRPGEARRRASTASRTVGGISSSPAARTSVTKNGLPPVCAVAAPGVDACGPPAPHRRPPRAARARAGPRRWSPARPARAAVGATASSSSR